MLDKMKYVNSKGESIEFGNGIYVNYSDVRDYEWEYVSKCNRIAGFRRNISKKSIPLVLVKASREELIAVRDRLYQVIEYDVINATPGKLYIGDFYLKCYLCGGKNSGYLARRDMQTTLTLVTDSNIWIKESHYSYSARGQEIVDSEDAYMDYPYDHSYDYASAILAYTADNMGFSEADFKMTIMGPCSAPEITIAGHPYKVDTELSSGEMLVIDSAVRKVYKIMVNGEQVNQFHLRDRENSVFKKIPAGNNTVTWDGSFSFELTLFEGRSEPRWI